MALTFTQLEQPQNQQYWLQVLLNQLQGVTPVIQNGATQTSGFYAGLTVQIGTGTVTATGPAIAAANVVVYITTSGNCGTGQFEFSLDGGVSYSTAVTIPNNVSANSGTYLINQIGVQLTFTNGTYYSAGSSNNYFILNETYNFQTFAPTFPVSNWEPGGVANTLTQADSQALADLNLTVAQVTAGGLTQSWITPPTFGPPPSGWLDLLSQNFYNRPRIAATQTQGGILLTAAVNSGPYTITNGQLYVSSNQGQLYQNIGGGTLPKGGTLSLTFGAQNLGASYNSVISYNPAALVPGGNYITTLLTPLPGVTVTNPLNSSPTVYHTGSGSATVTVVGTPTAEVNIFFKITTAGAVGTGYFAYSANGGNTFSAPILIPSTYVLYGMTASFGVGSFVVGDTYDWSTAWITQRGADVQSDASLATADQNQWAQLAPASPSGSYEDWALSASPEVVEAFVSVDPVMPGQVDILLSGQNNGPVSVAAISAVENYILQRIPLCVSIQVSTVLPITVNVNTSPSGGIVVLPSQLTAAQQGIAAALFALQESIAPGGEVFLSSVEAAIVGVTGVVQILPNTLVLNGAAQDIPLQPTWVATIVPPPSTAYST